MRELRMIFGEVASDYDEARLGYPDALVTAVYEFLGRTPERILEVGAGTGKATAAFTGHSGQSPVVMTCVEPDADMAAVLRARYVGDHRVTIWPGGFEEFPETGVPLIICAQAWHWVRPDVRLPKTHRMLEPGGVLALFGHEHAFADDAVEDRLNEAYALYAPELLEQPPGSPNQRLPRASWLVGELADSPLFTGATARDFVQVLPTPTPRYLALLATFSGHRALPEERRTRLHAALGEAIDRYSGGVLRQRVTTTLSMAHPVPR